MTGTADRVRLLGGDAVDELATVELGLAAAEEAALLPRDTVVTGRVQVDGDASWMRILAGHLTGLDLSGYKEFHRVGRRVRYHVHLFRESTGDALGIVDGRRITSIRTSSTAVVAVRAWARGRPVRVGIIGSGEEAREGLRALHGALAVTRTRVYSPTPANRAAFAADMGGVLGVEVIPADTQDEVLADSDVLYVATSSHHKAFLRHADVASVPMVAAIGSTHPVHREMFGDAFLGATVVVDTPDATRESGDCLEAIERGWDAGSVILLRDYLRGGASPPTDRTVFKSVGSIEQDLVLAAHLLRAAAEHHRGVLVEPIGSLRLMR
jgi:alanine dehydrogenase